MVTVERIANGAAGVEDEVVGVYADWVGDKHSVAEDVDEGDQARSGVGPRAGSGDRDGKFRRLRCGADRVDGADDRPVGVAAAGDGDESCGCQGEAGC